MEILDKLPDELYFNVVKYLEHPLAQIVKNLPYELLDKLPPYYLMEHSLSNVSSCMKYVYRRIENRDYDEVRCCVNCFHKMERHSESEYEYKFYPVYYCEYCEESDFDIEECF